MITTREEIEHRWKAIKSYIGWEDFIAIGLIIIGALGYFEGPIPFISHLTDFYLDIRSDLIGIGITVLIIDNVNEMYRRRAEKERLILQMGSPDHGFAIEAVRQLRSKGWLKVGLFRDADLIGANLTGADLSMANLSRTTLRGANLTGANLIGANLTEADLSGADLSGTTLRGANLSGAKLIGANLTGADLKRADLSEADLRGADLSGANLRVAYLSGADLTVAYLIGANLSGADLTGAAVTDEQLAQVETLEGTIMPDGKIYDPAIHTEIARLRREAGLEP